MMKRRIQVFIGPLASAALDSLVARGFTQVEAIERGLILIEASKHASRAEIRQYEAKRAGSDPVMRSAGLSDSLSPSREATPIECVHPNKSLVGNRNKKGARCTACGARPWD